MISKKRLKTLYTQAIQQGLTAEKITWSLCIGLLMGIIPLLWGSSLICLFIGWRWKLNHPLLQAANYAAYPLQIVLFLPFFETASYLFSSKTLFDEQLINHFFHQPLQLIETLWLINLQALVVWLVVSVVVLPILYFTVLSLLRRQRQSKVLDH